ncbi:MAG: peptide ABC transporter substrate-binding protein [Chloroflexi bacterium]|nr:peptide ABC transporter substrate-binding protein [Chloroflexota bacterium]
MKRIVLILIAMLLLSTACSQASPEATATPTQAPPPTLADTATATATLTPAPTLTPTPTIAPTRTPLPSPTPTPKGYYASNNGFTLILPSGWALNAEDGVNTVFNNLSDQLALLFAVVPEDPELTFTDIMEGVREEYSQGITDITIEYLDDITLGDDSVAQHAALRGLANNNNQQVELVFDILYATKPGKIYLIQTIGALEMLARRQDTIGRIYDSIRLESDQLYGVSRASSIVLLGYDPIEILLDPAQAQSNASDYVGHLYSGLVRLSPALQIEPDLAESWTVSADGTVYTFTLRSGLTFQNGSPLTAEDVAYSLERAADPATKSDTARTYLGDILGVQEKLDGEAEQISGVKVVDERTLAIALDGAKPYFLAKLTYPVAFVVDEDSVKNGGRSWMYTPNASGPFGLKDYREEEVIVFERNQNYYQPALLEHVVYLLGRAGTSISFYQAGDVDITGLDATRAKLVQEPAHELNKEMVSSTNMCTTMLMFNNTMPPMDDPKVRQAFIQAVEREGLITLLIEGIVPRADTILPPGMPGYSDALAVTPFDAASAKQTLAESSYAEAVRAGKLPEVTLTTGGYGDEENPYLDALVNMWRKTLGVTVKIEYLDPEHYTEAAREGHGQIATMGWCADYPDPENFLDILFHSESAYNVSGYSNTAVDELLEQARTEQDAAVRLQLYQQTEKLLLEDFAALPEWHGISFVLVKPYVKGYVVTSIGAPILHLLSIER